MPNEAAIIKFPENYNEEMPLQVGPPLFDITISPQEASKSSFDATTFLVIVVVISFLTFVTYICWKSYGIGNSKLPKK